MYLKKLTEELVLTNARREHAIEMGVLQRLVFPTLSPEALMTSDHFAAHIEIFPEGQVVVLFKDKVVGSTSTFRSPFPKPDHTFLEATGNLWLTTHDPKGEWLYGFDMGVHPDFQGLGLGRHLYRARCEICRDLKLAGQVIVGMPSGYGKVAATVPFERYFDQVLKEEVFDPTVSMQIRMGFEPQMIIPEHLVDPKCGNYGVLMQLPVEKMVSEPLVSVEAIAKRAAKFTF